MKTTASNLERISLCPGSLAISEGLQDRSSPEAQAGNRIHAALAQFWRPMSRHLPHNLPSAEYDILQAYINESRERVAGFVKDAASNLLVEHRMSSGLEFSGQPDLIVLCEREDPPRALILDWKTGWIEQSGSPTNLQLRGYAVLVHENYGVEQIDVALLQRYAKTNFTRYYLQDITRAQEEIAFLISRAHSESGIKKRIPGEIQCRYCKAIGICPEARSLVDSSIHLAEIGSEIPINREIDKNTAELVARSLDGIHLAQLQHNKRIAEMVFEATDREIKKRLNEDPESVPGWKLKPGATRRCITDVVKAYELLLNSGEITGSAFAECCSVRIGDLEDRFRKATGASGSQAKQALSERLADVIEEKQNEPSIVRAV